jgi:hypothetical protein
LLEIELPASDLNMERFIAKRRRRGTHREA